ncbi:LysR family transcriptional regulator [Stakelama tenebrarum]|uniref:LysR family transcriptional regulator n=1 Tax=Stakelama tenebrarum TaxID=2711215 RepID=A0A6G6Y199_9SPHN|nr:LysR family transcriptional regulator [Sphingosinithalassobacter tenebrarum]QIG78611.1 LysR family transcriptional regulator [Sphingosinithalassobacter tenebrarum]
MNELDLNLLVALDALLTEGSVVGAAGRLNLSPSAMSRTLSRLRAATGDPLLVRAGRGLVATPRALELREPVKHLVEDARVALRPAEALDLTKLETTFTLRTSDGFVQNFGPALLERLAADAPGVRVDFAQKQPDSSEGLRDGAVDLEIGVVHSATGPEVRTQALFRDRFIGVVRQGHALTRSEITAATYAAQNHVLGPRDSADRSPIDDALAALGLERRIGTIVIGFASALALVRGTDLVAAVPERHTDAMRDGLSSFPLPFAVPQITVSLLWHPRLDADPAQAWLRSCVREVCSRRKGDFG